MKLLSSLWLTGLFALTFLAARPARADVVPEPPAGCIDGSVGATCHGGPFCALDLCTTDADCDEGKACQDHNLCTATIDCGGGNGPDPTTQVTGDCAGGCPAGSVCAVQKVCVTPSGGTTGSTTGGAGAPAVGGGGGSSAGGSGGGDDYVVTGCACTLGPGGRALGAAGALLFAAGLAGLGGRRRRRSGR